MMGQKCSYQKVDGLDLVGDTHHLMTWHDGQSLTYLRLLDPARREGQVVIGRAVSPLTACDQGLGHRLMECALQTAEHFWLDTPVYLSTQIHLQGYYSRYGFVAVTEAHLEDDISHIGMCRA